MSEIEERIRKSEEGEQEEKKEKVKLINEVNQESGNNRVRRLINSEEKVGVRKKLKPGGKISIEKWGEVKQQVSSHSSGHTPGHTPGHTSGHPSSHTSGHSCCGEAGGCL